MSALAESIAIFRALDEGMTPAARKAMNARRPGEGRIHHLARRADWALGDAASKVKKTVGNVKSKIGWVGRNLMGRHGGAGASAAPAREEPRRVKATPKPRPQPAAHPGNPHSPATSEKLGNIAAHARPHHPAPPVHHGAGAPYTGGPKTPPPPAPAAAHPAAPRVTVRPHAGSPAARARLVAPPPGAQHPRGPGHVIQRRVDPTAKENKMKLREAIGQFRTFDEDFSKASTPEGRKRAELSYNHDNMAHAGARHMVATGQHPFKPGSLEHKAMHVYALGNHDRLHAFEKTSREHMSAAEKVWSHAQSHARRHGLNPKKHLTAPLHAPPKPKFESFDRLIGLVTEAKAGDYVTAKDGRAGYVQSATGGKLAVMLTNQPSNKKGSIFYIDSGSVTVNPGGAPENKKPTNLGPDAASPGGKPA